MRAAKTLKNNKIYNHKMVCHISFHRSHFAAQSIFGGDAAAAIFSCATAHFAQDGNLAFNSICMYAMMSSYFMCNVVSIVRLRLHTFAYIMMGIYSIFARP